MEAQGETTIWLLKQEMANQYRRELKLEDCQNRLKQYVEVSKKRTKKFIYKRKIFKYESLVEFIFRFYVETY